jgi:flavodoxin
MKALVVYDSAFGNTEQVAQAIHRALGGAPEVDIGRAADMRPEHLVGLDLLVAGSPTQKFSALPAVTRWLKGIPANGLAGVKVAAFDTRVPIDDNVPGILRLFARLFGYAAEPMAQRLVKKGGEQVVSPEGFFVLGTEGPLKEGELDRAAEWARQIAAAV